MSRVLLSGDNQITWSFGKHGGWSKGIDIVRFENRLEKITVHTAGKVIKVVNYLDGTNKILDKEGMGYGNYVMVLHKGNLVTLYGHLEHVTVNEGQEINQGTVIGYMGNTGISYVHIFILR
jgi:murein DD-endopeptidase MepM/ murein hydrolase activator NlpD